MSRARVVTDPEGHVWTVRRHANWRRPAGTPGDDFEFDVASGSLAAVVITSLIVTAAVVFVASTPDATIAPKVELAVFALVAFFPVRWLLRRPWTIVAETGDEEAERWVGTVRGPLAAIQEFRRTAREIEADSHPDLDGNLQTIN